MSNTATTTETIINRIAKVEEIVSELLGDKAAVEWLNETNEHFFGRSPVQMILLGQEHAVIDHLQEKLGIEVESPTSAN